MNRGLRILSAGKTYGRGENATVAVDGCTIDIAEGQFCAIVGPSGCGKSTLLNAVAGFEQLSQGRIELDGRVINSVQQAPKPGPERMVVFQNGALFPWATVAENLIRAPIVQGRMTNVEAMAEARDLLARVGLNDLWHQYPSTLSSGMLRRIEIIRALLINPQVILLDEPFRGLDTVSKNATHACLLELWQARPRTVMMVTHDLDEALLLADKVVVMSSRPGRVRLTLDVDLPRPRPENIQRHPAFLALKAQLIEAVHEEALKAFTAGERELA